MGESKGEGEGERTFRVDPSDLELGAGYRDPDGPSAPRVVGDHRAQGRELGHTPRLVRAGLGLGLGLGFLGLGLGLGVGLLGLGLGFLGLGLGFLGFGSGFLGLALGLGLLDPNTDP